MKNKCRLSPLALGLSLGVLWGVSLLIVGLLAHFASYGIEFVKTMNAIYIVYSPSILGSIVGGIIGFIDAFIGGVIIAWLYNLFGGCNRCHTETPEL